MESLYEDVFVENLRAAIIERAVMDYNIAQKHNDEKEIKKLEKFFLSSWGQLLSDYHGDDIIKTHRKK